MTLTERRFILRALATILNMLWIIALPKLQPFQQKDVQRQIQEMNDYARGLKE